MTIRPGDTFMYPYPKEKKHLHIVVEKVIDKVMLICAFVSSIPENRGYDKSCMLEEGDTPFIKHPSYVVYDKMQFFDASTLERMIENGQIKDRGHVEEAVLKRVIDGALNSKMTPNIFRKYLSSV